MNRSLKTVTGKIVSAIVITALGAVVRSAQPSDSNGENPETSYMGEMLVTASRIPEPANTVPANTTIITAEDIAETTAQTVPDVLKYYAGIQVSDWLGNGRNTSVDVRGFGETAGANTLVLVDGRRINAPDLSGVDWTTVPLERIRRIEIVRGGGSVMHGDNATGGVINIITKQGAENTPLRLETDTRVGSYQTFKQSLTLSGSDGPWQWNANAGYHDSDGYRDNGYFRNKTGGLRLGYDAGGMFSIDLSAGYKDDRYGLAGWLPESHGDPTDTLFPFDYVETTEAYVQVTPQVRIGDNTTLSLALNYRDYNQYSVSVFMGMPSLYEYNLYEYGIGPRLASTQDWLGMTHQISAGIGYYSSDLHYIEAFSPGDRHRHETGYYVHDKIGLTEKLYLSLGYRRTRIEYDFESAKDDAFNTDSYAAGLTYNYAEGSKVFAAFDRAFRSVRLDELGGGMFVFTDPLPPQISKHYQLGIQHAFGDKLILAATAFLIDTEDEIFYDPMLMTNTSYEETRRQGIELEAFAYPTDKIRVFANYTWMNAELKDGAYDENEIPGVAEHTGALGATVYPTENLTLDIRGRWARDKRLISDWGNAADDWDGNYFVVNALLSYKWNIFTFYAGVNNIFDREYTEYGVYSFDYLETFTTGPLEYPSPERNFIAGVKITKEF